MIVHCHRHNLLGLLLSDNILVQSGLDHMGSRYILHGQGRLLLRLLFDLLLLWYLHGRRSHIKVTKIHVHVRHIGQLGKIHSPLHDGIKCFLHTIVAQIHIARHGDHGAGLALRPAAHIADLLISFILFVLAVRPLLAMVYILIPFFQILFFHATAPPLPEASSLM